MALNFNDYTDGQCNLMLGEDYEDEEDEVVQLRECPVIEEDESGIDSDGDEDEE